MVLDVQSDGVQKMIVKIECKICGKVASWNNLEIGADVWKLVEAAGWGKVDGYFQCPECSGLKFPL